MTEPKTKYPLEAFGPELMAVLLKGGREPVMLKFPGPDGRKKAHAFQRRIHTLRVRMRQANHPDYMLATRARVSLFWGRKAVAEGGPKEWEDDPHGALGAIIIARPHDSEFSDVLREAGVEVTPLPPPVPSTPLTPSPEMMELEDFLDELASKPKE